MSERPSILMEILAHKREEVAAAKLRVSPAQIAKQAARKVGREAGPRRFRRWLEISDNQPSLIAEVKAASPSQGAIRPGLDPVAVARAYERAGAECLSVLTDAKYFGGSPENLIQIRSGTDLPILRKDFVFDEYQLDEALAWGADAVLLIVAMLPPEEIARLHRAAQEREMDALVEVHSVEEARMAEEIGAELIGINNRDLSTFETDLGTTRRVIESLGTTGALIVSESALATPEDLSEVADAGARAVLIGTAFCAEPDVESAVRRIMGREPVEGRRKDG